MKNEIATLQIKENVKGHLVLLVELTYTNHDDADKALMFLTRGRANGDMEYHLIKKSDETVQSESDWMF